MPNLIPKSLAKQKGIFYKNIAWIDVCIFLIDIAISCGITLGLVFFNWWVRIILTFVLVLVLFMFTLPYSRANDCRAYKLIWYKIRFLISDKKYHDSNNLNPYMSIHNEFVYTKKPKEGRSHYIGMIKIRGLDISSLNDNEARIKLDQFHSIINHIKKHFSLAKINEAYSMSYQAKYYDHLLDVAKNDYDNALISEEEYKTRKEQILNLIETINNVGEKLDSNPLQSNYYLILYDINFEELQKDLIFLKNEIESLGLFCDILDPAQCVNVIKGIFNPFEDKISDQVIQDNQTNLDEIFTFDSVEFKKDHLVINDQLLISFLSVSNYPTEVDNYWLAYMFLSINANVIINAKQINQAQAVSLINKAIVNSASNAFSEKKAVAKMESEAINEGFKMMAQDMIRNDQSVFTFNVLIANYEVDHKSLIKSNRLIEKTLNSKLIKVNRLKYRQFEALNSFLPKINDSLTKDIGREVPSRTFANGYPFLNSSINDKQGTLLGTNWLNEPVIFDPFVLNDNRKNHNVMILGSSGSGKSFFTKKMINWFGMSNKRVFILDVENEYQGITKNYDGNLIDIGSGQSGIINPLEIIKTDQNISNSDAILNHVLVMESFLKILFNEISETQLRYLTNLIKQYYFENEYTEKNFDSLEQIEWPIFDDILEFAKSKQNKLSKSYTSDDVQYVHELLRSELSGEGKLAFLYNKHSTISINKKLACFNLNSLIKKNNMRIMQAQLFLSLNYIQKEIKDNDYTKEPIVIIIDEAHLLIDENNPVALDFVYQMSKRIRKRNGSIVIITQSPEDFNANENIVKKTRAILNNTQYSFFFNLSPNNIKDVAKMYENYGSGLSEDEKLFIAKAKRGQALFLVSGFDRHQLNIYVSEEEEKIFK